MEGGNWAVGGRVLGAAQEPQGQQREDEKEAGAAAAERKKGAAAGGMKFRVRARAPHGVGALLLIGGAAVVGAAVLAWRRSRHGHAKKGAAVDKTERRLPPKEEGLDGGTVEDEKVQGASLVQKLNQSDENLSAGNTDVGSGALCQGGNVSEESHQFHKDDEITADRLESKHEEKIDENSGSNPVEVRTQNLERKHEEKIAEILGSNPVEVHTHGLNKEQVEKIDLVDQKSSCKHVEITAHDMCQDNEHVEKIDHVEGFDQNPSRNPVKIIMQEMVNVSGSVEKVEEDSSKKDNEKEIAQKDNKDMEASDRSKLGINGPGIILSKHNDETDGTQEAESMENTPTAQLMMHQDQLLDDMVTDTVTETEDTVTETEEAKQDERTITDESNKLEQDENKDLVGPVELARSPALSSLVKPVVKKDPEFPRPNETGMKIEQDYGNGELREHNNDLISKGGAMQGEGDIATMECRSSALVILALIFALAMGIIIIVRLYAPSRATKLQMDLP